MAAEPVTLAEIEREAILERLAAFGGNRTHAAESLGISIRTLRNKLAIYRLGGHKIPPAPTQYQVANSQW